MHRLLIRSTHCLNTKHTPYSLNSLQLPYSQGNSIQNYSSTKDLWIQRSNCSNNFQGRKSTMNESNVIKQTIGNDFNKQYCKKLISQSRQGLHLKFTELKYPKMIYDSRYNSQTISQVPQSSSHSQTFSLSKWLKRLLIIAFVTKLLQQQGYRCDYDINDMMVTIQLDQRLLQQEEDNKQDDESQEAKKKKPFKPKRSSIKQVGHGKDDRYGTVEQMLRHQMSSSEDFHSVEERILIKEIQEKRDLQQKDNNGQKKEQNSQKRQQQRDKENHVKESLASHIFKPQQIRKVQKSSQPQQRKRQTLKASQALQSNKTSSISIEKAQQNLASHKQNQPSSGMKQTQGASKIEHNKPQEQLKVNPITSTIEQKPSHQQFIDAESSAIIYLQSQKMEPISKRIENFLTLRGIKVRTQSSLQNSPLLRQSKETLKIRLCNKLTECKDISFLSQDLEYRDMLHHMNNFLNPPHIINSIQQAKQLLTLLHNDQSIVSSYIPITSSSYQSHQHKSIFDTFSARHPPVNPSEAQKKFNQYKYLSSSRKNCFVIVRNEQVAKYMKIPTNKVGTPYVLYKYDKELNGKNSEPNCRIDGEFYHAIGNVDKMIQKQGLDTVEKVAHKINSLTERGFINSNVIEDVHDKIRQLNQQTYGFEFSPSNIDTNNNRNNHKKPNKKLFVIKTNDPESQKQINQILQKLSKLNKNEVTILKTQSQALLKSLRIFNNDEYATLRLFDLDYTQQPIIKQQQIIGNRAVNTPTNNNYFNRYIPNGPFQLQFLSRWISNLTPFDKPHTQLDKSINKLQSSYPHDLQPIKSSDNHPKLVLFYKEGCKGCKLMEQLLSHLIQLQQRLRTGDNESVKKLTRQICLRYRIQDPQQLSNLHITRFNILNDDPTIEVPQTTPAIYLFNEKNSEKYIIKTQEVFKQLNKMQNNNQEIVHDYMIRELIEEIQKNVRKMDGVV